MLLSIDPGADTGWALFEETGRLSDCGLGEPSAYMHMLRVWDLIIEQPIVYPRAKSRPNDLITLALCAGELKGRLHREGRRAEYVKPFEWKGQVPKKKHQPRIWAVLDEREHALLLRETGKVLEGEGHNIVDAVGIGLWRLGRLSR
jgi:hypothetical protein